MLTSLEYHLSELADRERDKDFEIAKGLLLLKYWLDCVPEFQTEIDGWLQKAFQTLQVVLAANELGGAMNKPIVSHRRIDQLKAIAFDCSFTSEDAKQFGKLSKTATWEALLETYGIPPQVVDTVDKAQSIDTGASSFSRFRVLGLDICKSSIVGCLLTQRPLQPREAYHSLEFFKLKAGAAGIKQLLSLNPDVVVMKSTRVNYQRPWIIRLARVGIEVRLVGNKLPAYRNNLDLPDKNHKALALALACYFFDYQHLARQFLVVREAWLAK